ncbi:hypothetical protein CCP4SC76_4520003 [Gammaproteobacteria bacterium]
MIIIIRDQNTSVYPNRNAPWIIKACSRCGSTITTEPLNAIPSNRCDDAIGSNSIDSMSIHI